MTISQTCSKDTINSFQQGDKTAFKELYDKYSPAILGVLIRAMADQKLAEECLSKVFCKVWSQRLCYHPEKEGLFTWILSIACGCATNEMSDGKQSSDQILEDINLVCATDAKAYLKQKIRTEPANIENCISATMLQAIDLVYFKSNAFALTAEKLNMSVDSLKREMIKTIKQLMGSQD